MSRDFRTGASGRVGCQVMSDSAIQPLHIGLYLIGVILPGMLISTRVTDVHYYSGNSFWSDSFGFLGLSIPYGNGS